MHILGRAYVALTVVGAIAGIAHAQVQVPVPAQAPKPATPTPVNSVVQQIKAPPGGPWPMNDKAPPYDVAQMAGLDISKVPVYGLRVPATGCPGNKADGCWWTCNQCVSPEDVTRCPGPKQWGLTFDDGPSGNTTALLDFLDQTKVKATFFIVGSRVTENPEILKRAFDAGHQIALHTWSHTALTTQTNEQIIAEMYWTRKIIKSVIGLSPTHMRPPYGDIDDRVRGVLSAMGIKVILWDRDTNDWRLNFGNPTNYNPSWISGNETAWIDATAKGQDNPITLEHDLTVEGIREAMTVIPRITAAGISVIPVGECIKDNKWYMEDSGTETRSTSAGSIRSAASSLPATSYLLGLLLGALALAQA